LRRLLIVSVEHTVNERIGAAQHVPSWFLSTSRIAQA